MVRVFTCVSQVLMLMWGMRVLPFLISFFELSLHDIPLNIKSNHMLVFYYERLHKCTNKSS